MYCSRQLPEVRRHLIGFAFGLLAFTLSTPAISQESEAQTPYDSVWQQVSQLLGVREYASALEVIADAENDSGLRAFREQLQIDRKDIQGLQKLAGLVKDRLTTFKEGDALKIGNSEYKFGRFVSDAQGDRIVLNSTADSSKSEKTLSQLDPKTWISLAEPKLSNSAEDRYIAGMFLASVEQGDRQAARQALNLAAAEKIPVSHWISRIEAEAKAREDELGAKKAELDDPILGTWRFVIGDGKRERRLNITFRARGKTDLKTSTWRKVKDDEYVISFPNGASARVNLGPKGEGVKGKMANGTPVKGLRQSKAKR